MLRLLLSKAQGHNIKEKHPNPVVLVLWIVLIEYSLMSTDMPKFQSFFLGFLHYFVLAYLATISIRVKWESDLFLCGAMEYTCLDLLL